MEENKQNRANIIHYSIETYFIWFSALIFVTELITDVCLVIYYFHENQLQWATVTLTIIVVPQILCQIYSLVLLKSEEQRMSGNAIFWHLCLMGIPFRYHNILRTIEKGPIQEVDVVRYKIREVNAIQTVNSVLQYCPQFIFQSFLIIHRKYKCVITGVSAGLSGFSFLWHMFIHFFYLIKRYNEDLVVAEVGSCVTTPRIIDNLSGSAADSEGNAQGRSVATLRENFKDFEKPLYNTDDKNLMVKKAASKNVEKNKIFSFNKRKPIYEREDFDLYSGHNQSTVFCEINDSLGSEKFPSQTNFKEANKWTKLEKDLSSSCDTLKQYHSTDKLTESSDKATKSSTPVTNCAVGQGNFVLKRKGICSSQEMLHLVDLMNENLSAEQVDILAKSLIELGGAPEESIVNPSSDSGELDSSKLLEVFPEVVDESTQSSILENIDAAIYENQIIFQERIKKNQLTIQNLKLQDQILSSFIDTSFSSNDLLSTRDYENMCVVNINRTNRGMKHWRNYLQDIDANVHDNSTVLNSSFFVTTTASATDDLYIHENQSALADDGSKSMESEKSAKGSDAVREVASGGRKTVRWCNKVSVENYSASSGSDDSHHVDSRLVETINKINVDSPIKHLTIPVNPMDSITESIHTFEESH